MNVSRALAMTAGCAVLALSGQPVHASDARAAFAGCVAAKTSSKDDVVLARWLFLAMAEHPAIRGLARVDPAQSASVDEGMAALFQRLVAQDCVAQLRALRPEEMPAAFETAFTRLGERAGTAIFAAPEVSAATTRMTALLDMAAIEAALAPAP
jgi:hypothetical protein